MTNNAKNAEPRAGGTGQAGNTGTTFDCPYYITRDKIAQAPIFDTAMPDGPPILWGVCDALHTLARELVKRGLVADDNQLTAAIHAAWLEMCGATYMPMSLLAELRRAGVDHD